MCRKIHPLTGEVVQKLTPEVKVLRALGQKPDQKQNRQYRSSGFSRVHLPRFSPPDYLWLIPLITDVGLHSGS